MQLKIFCDGGSRGNPGESALGFVVYDDNNNIIKEEGISLGIGTNNQAEYKAVIAALEFVTEKKEELSVSSIDFFLDSELVVKQVTGLYKIKEPTLREYWTMIKTLELNLAIPISFTHVPRAENKAADRMVNIALDEKILRQ